MVRGAKNQPWCCDRECRPETHERTTPHDEQRNRDGDQQRETFIFRAGGEAEKDRAVPPGGGIVRLQRTANEQKSRDAERNQRSFRQSGIAAGGEAGDREFGNIVDP